MKNIEGKNVVAKRVTIKTVRVKDEVIGIIAGFVSLGLVAGIPGVHVIAENKRYQESKERESLEESRWNELTSDQILERIKETKALNMLAQATNSNYFTIAGSEMMYGYDDNSITNRIFEYGVNARSNQAYSIDKDVVTGEIEYSCGNVDVEEYIQNLIYTAIGQREVLVDGENKTIKSPYNTRSGVSSNGNKWTSISSDMGYVKVTEKQSGEYEIEIEERDKEGNQDWCKYVISPITKSEFTERYDEVAEYVGEEVVDPQEETME